MRGLAFGLVAVLLCGASPVRPAVATAPRVADKVAERMRQDLRDAVDAYQRDDCRTTLKLVEPRLKPGSVGEMPAPLATAAYELAASCAYRTDKTVAHRYAIAGTELDGASDLLWRFRLGIELDGEQFEAAVTTVEAMTQGRGAALNSVPIRWFYGLERDLKDGKLDALRLRLLRVLADNSYDPDEVLVSNDPFRLKYAEMLYAAGNKEAAAAQVRAIEDPSVVVELSVDLRFRAMVPADYDARTATERKLAQARAEILRHPAELAPIVEASKLLRQLGRPKEALELLESAGSDEKARLANPDSGEWLNWWWDAVARTNEMLGNLDAAADAFRKGARANEDGHLNVSQLINLAHAQNRFGKPADALATLAPFESGMPLSPYGELAMRIGRGCANALLGNVEAIATDRAFIEAHQRDGPAALGELLLCLNDMNGAATEFIRRLDDPDLRAKALLELSDYDPPIAASPEGPIDGKLPALKARADVQAAIARAGGTRRIPLQRGEL